MTVQIVYKAFQCPCKPSGIAGLLSDILILEERLKAPDDQSEYFRWSLESHFHHLAELLVEYDRIRGEFNRYTPSHFRNEINAQDQRIQAHVHLTPLIARAMVRSRAQRVILEMEDMIALKSITDYLPTVSELKNEPELLEALLSYK